MTSWWSGTWTWAGSLRRCPKFHTTLTAGYQLNGWKLMKHVHHSHSDLSLFILIWNLRSRRTQIMASGMHFGASKNKLNNQHLTTTVNNSHICITAFKPCPWYLVYSFGFGHFIFASSSSSQSHDLHQWSMVQPLGPLRAVSMLTHHLHQWNMLQPLWTLPLMIMLTPCVKTLR